MTEGQTDARGLRAADAAEVEPALADALQFDGRKAFRRADNMMAAIAAAHVPKCLDQAHFVVMKEPPAVTHSAPASN
jgi:hypothetical protein